MVKELFLYPGIYNLGYINPVQSAVVTAIPTLVDGMVEKEFFFHIGNEKLAALQSQAVLLKENVSPLGNDRIQTSFLYLIHFPTRLTTTKVVNAPVFLS